MRSKIISQIQKTWSDFAIPATVLSCLLLYLGTFLLPLPQVFGHSILWVGIAVGSWNLLSDTWQSLITKSFALDYIAILAILVGLFTGNYFVSGVVVLMMSGGNALESYAQRRAKQSLTALKSRIPNQTQLLGPNDELSTVAIEDVQVGSSILIRKGEVIPLDGHLVSTQGIFDESSLTGEAYPITKSPGDVVRSGTINVGNAISITTTVLSKDSTYSRIVALVKEAEHAQTPFIVLADKLSLAFTLVTLVLAAAAYLISGDMNRVLAVLVIATPCPLILATPIALIGGMNVAAQQRIIFKRLAMLEILSRVKTIVLDKTGTITIGTPQLANLEILSKDFSSSQILELAGGLEKNSLHPYAKAILLAAQQQKLKPAAVSSVTEVLGHGIQGKFKGQTFELSASQQYQDSQVILKQGKTELAIFTFKDELKPSSVAIVKKIQDLSLNLTIFTGDTWERAQDLLKKLPAGIGLEAELSPSEKKTKLQALQQNNYLVAMVGDGINDAPALAAADVGLAFSHQEHTATSEAADVVLLGKDFSGVYEAIHISQQTMTIAKQSMYIGLGLSIAGMLLALGGYLPPLLGALGQEIIDVAVIINALRTTRIRSLE